MAEESVEVLLLQLDCEEAEAGVEEVGRLLHITGDLRLSLTETSYRVKQVTVRTARNENLIAKFVYSHLPPEDPIGAEQAGRHLLADEELGAGGLLTVVARLAARVQRAHRHRPLGLRWGDRGA